MEEVLPIRRAASREGATSRQAAALLELFYPIHYRGNMALEDAMRGELTRKQAAILWLIHSSGSDHGRCMRRKEIVLRLQDWFDVSSPAVTQSLRKMARPPLGLVRLVEDADSGREKRVLLTARGGQFILTMVARGREFLRRVVGQMSERQVEGGIKFLRAGIVAYEHLHATGLDDVSKPAPGHKRRVHRAPGIRLDHRNGAAPYLNGAR